MRTRLAEAFLAKASRAPARSARAAALGVALILTLTSALSARQAGGVDVSDVLKRAGERVAEYFTRAQSIMCLEKVALQQLGLGFSAEAPARVVESELRLSWEPTEENPVPIEAKTLRQVLRVNGGKPRKDDYNNCTTPEQNDVEQQPLSMLLPQQLDKYTFSYDRREILDSRAAIVIAFREVRKPAVAVTMVDDKEDCISYVVEGGRRGRIWIDSETYEVLRLDHSFVGWVDVPLPRKAIRPNSDTYFTVERSDVSIRFKRVGFQDPQETLVLPVSSSELRITRGSGTQRLRTNTQYLSYRRFLTGARLIPPQM